MLKWDEKMHQPSSLMKLGPGSSASARLEPMFRMCSSPPNSRVRPSGASALLAVVACVATAGCANPGPPRPPSLFLPAPVTRLAAQRVGDAVDVRFTVPARSTDGLPLRARTLAGSLCREVEHAGCAPVASLPAKLTVEAKAPNGQPSVVIWRDKLSPELASGAPRTLAYRVEFYNAAGVSGGKSDPVFAAGGAAPPAVTGLRAEGARAGVVLRWATVSTGSVEVLVRREDTRAADAHAPSRTPKVTWIAAQADTGTLLDATAQPGVAYTYSAQRRSVVQLGGRSLEMRSALSPPIAYTLREVYAPAAPTGLNTAGYTAQNGQFAVDLIWQPVNDAQLSGYNVSRQPLDASGNPSGPSTRLNDVPVPLPAFHDATARSATGYRYAVTAVDAHGNESAAVSATLLP
jgi:hypothetical protein